MYCEYLQISMSCNSPRGIGELRVLNYLLIFNFDELLFAKRGNWALQVFSICQLKMYIAYLACYAFSGGRGSSRQWGQGDRGGGQTVSSDFRF